MPGRRGTLALSYAVPNKGAGFPPAGLPSPSSLRDATSPKVRGLGSPPSFRFGIFTPCCRKGSRQALRSDFTPLPRAPTLGELDAVRRPERASPLTGRQGLCLADAFGRERASPLTAATEPRFRLCFRWGCASAGPRPTKKPASIGFERPVGYAGGGMPRSVCINIWPGCWTGTS